MKYRKNQHEKFDNNFQEALASKLKFTIKNNDLKLFKKLVEETCQEMDIDILDCAAALVSLYQPGLSYHRQHQHNNVHPPLHKSQLTHYLHNDIKMVRYRLEIGRKHKVGIDDLKNLLVDETGVDRKHIGFIDMHHHYTLLKLPEGMPPDIYNHLKTVQINKQLLKIRRLGNTGKQQQKPVNGEKQLANRKQRKIKGKVKNIQLNKPQLDNRR